MLNKLFLAISLSGLLMVNFANAAESNEVAPCSNGFDDVNVCELRS
jgi:hypothetical protein